MTDQIRRLVEQGEIKNYDVCFQHNFIVKLASQNPVANDDLNQSLSKDRLCRLYYNNAFWRGGINGSIDDRIKSPSHAGWTPDVANTSKQAVGVYTNEFNNNVNRVRQGIVSVHVYGSSNDVANVTNIKNDTERVISSMKAQNNMLERMITALKKENSDEMLQEVADRETKIRVMENENNQYRSGNEMRREQTKDLYQRYDSNFNSSAFGYYFGYNPLNPSSQSTLLFTSFFMGLIGLVTLGIQVAPILLGTGSAPATAPRAAASNIRKPSASMF